MILIFLMDKNFTNAKGLRAYGDQNVALHLLIFLSHILALLSPTNNPFNGSIYFYLNVILKTVLLLCVIYFSFKWIVLFCFLNFSLSTMILRSIHASMSMSSSLLLPATARWAFATFYRLTRPSNACPVLPAPCCPRAAETCHGHFLLGPGWECPQDTGSVNFWARGHLHT